MITALRKIEGRGELEGATSAVMEMCVDNPRSGFADLFATHPSIESRIEAIVKFAGGRDPGPLALPEPEPTQPRRARTATWTSLLPPDPGRFRRAASRRRQAVPAGAAADRARRHSSTGGGEPGPWGPHRETSRRTPWIPGARRTREICRILVN